MNEGVQILIERMKTHPEEFVPNYDGGSTKWGNAIGQYRTYLTAEDNKALDDAWKETVVVTMQERFTARVMEELLDPKEETNPLQYRSGTGLAGTTLGAYSNTANVTLNANSMTLGNQTLDEATIQHMKAHLEYTKVQMEKEKAKLEQKKQTLFGKLFNYT